MTEQTKVVRPKGKEKTIYMLCGRCEKVTPQEIVASVDYEYDGDIRVWQRYQVVRCGLCNSFSFRKVSQCSEDIDIDEAGEPVFPERQELYPRRAAGRPLLKASDGIPPSVLHIYNETCAAIANDQPVLAAAGIRAIVEAACKERRAQGHNLEEKIDHLAAKGWLSDREAEVLHRTRLLGNRALHEVKAHSGDVLNAALEVTEHILRTVYTLKARSAKLPHRKRRTQARPTASVPTRPTETPPSNGWKRERGQ